MRFDEITLLMTKVLLEGSSRSNSTPLFIPIEILPKSIINFGFTGCPRKIDTVKFDYFTSEGTFSAKYVFMELKADYLPTKKYYYFLPTISHL